MPNQGEDWRGQLPAGDKTLDQLITSLNSVRADVFNTHKHREPWLHSATEKFRPIFAKNGGNIPTNIRVACGFPSVGGRSGLRNQRIGECWPGSASKDGCWEILISPTLAEPARVLDVLAHELIHATVGLDKGHKGPFRELALAIGLTGKMTATVAGEAFKRSIVPILESLGPYPHAELDTRLDLIDPGAGEPRLSSGPRTQTTRLLKVMCHCGYTARVTLKWLDEAGPPHCPLPYHGPMTRQP
jgi:hypothetical protein